MALKFLILLFVFTFMIQARGDFVRTLDPQSLGYNKDQNLTHFHFYFHDTLSGSNPTAVPIVLPPKRSSPAGFGAVNMFDDPLTEGPQNGSKLVGRAQGFNGVACQTEICFIEAMNIVFLDDKYNGSYITVLGRNRIFYKARERPVVGGSGVFRFARGYALANTISLNLTTGDAVVEYNLYVTH